MYVCTNYRLSWRSAARRLLQQIVEKQRSRWCSVRDDNRLRVTHCTFHFNDSCRRPELSLIRNSPRFVKVSESLLLALLWCSFENGKLRTDSILRFVSRSNVTMFGVNSRRLLSCGTDDFKAKARGTTRKCCFLFHRDDIREQSRARF